MKYNAILRPSFKKLLFSGADHLSWIGMSDGTFFMCQNVLLRTKTLANPDLRIRIFHNSSLVSVNTKCELTSTVIIQFWLLPRYLVEFNPGLMGQGFK